MNLKSDGVNPWKKFQLRSKKVTSAITALSVAYLLIPLLLSIWAMFMMFKLDSIQKDILNENTNICLLYTSPSPRDRQKSRMPSSA